MKIGRTYRFEAAHWLPGVPETHKCRRMHGNNYRVDVVINGSIDTRGFVMDFAELDSVVGPLVAACDHRVLNNVVGLENPTVEIIATWFAERIPGSTVRVYENDCCWAETGPVI